MSKQALKELKKLVRSRSDNHSQIQKFLSVHFAEAPNLVKTGSPSGDEFLEAMVAMVVLRMLGPSARASHLKMVHSSCYDCIQGEFKVGARRGRLFFFEDIGTGLVCVFASNGRIDTNRFRAKLMPENFCPLRIAN